MLGHALFNQINCGHGVGMSALFEEIDYAPTPIGAISLRRRHVLALQTDVYEIMLGDQHLMSSLFTASEEALANLAISALGGPALDVLVGGLGLGYTAQTALAHDNVARVTVIELLEPVIRWHQEGLVPIKDELATDPRCQLRQGDFFSLAASPEGFDTQEPERQYDAILIDIDHTPDRLLHEGSEGFYSTDGLKGLRRFTKAGGIVGLWSDEAPDQAIIALLDTAFAEAWAEPVVFANPLQRGHEMTQTVYLARKD